MVVNVYLDNDIVNMIEYYGSIDDVVNRILDHGTYGDIELIDLPAVEMPKINGKQYKVNVTNQTYIELCELYTTKSSRISLRRIIYWFMYNEKYIEFNWQSENKFINKSHEKIISIVGEIEPLLYKLYKLLDDNGKIAALKDLLNEIKQEVWNG